MDARQGPNQPLAGAAEGPELRPAGGFQLLCTKVPGPPKALDFFGGFFDEGGNPAPFEITYVPGEQAGEICQAVLGWCHLNDYVWRLARPGDVPLGRHAKVQAKGPGVTGRPPTVTAKMTILPSISMVDSFTCLRYAECSRAPDYVINGYGCPMQTIY